MLFAHGYASPRAAEEMLRTAEEDYRHVEENLEVLHAALHGYDDAMRILPGFADYYAEHETLDRELWQTQPLPRTFTPCLSIRRPRPVAPRSWMRLARASTSSS